MTGQITTGNLGSDPVNAKHLVESELVVGLVGAIGTELKRIGELLEKQLVRAGYCVHRVKISRDVIPLFGTVEHKNDQFDRIRKLMDAGNAARDSSNDDSVLALGASATIAAKRSGDGSPSYRTAYIIDSLKRPEEVERLRKIYPGGFILVGVYAEEGRRLRALTDVGISPEDAQNSLKTMRTKSL